MGTATIVWRLAQAYAGELDCVCVCVCVSATVAALVMRFRTDDSDPQAAALLRCDAWEVVVTRLRVRAGG